MSSMPPAPTKPEAEPALPADVGRWIEHHAALRPDDLAWADDSRRCSYREAAERVARLARWLRIQGVSRGDRVALWLANRGAVLEAVFACARIGAIALPINTRLTPAEVAFQLADATPRVLLVERDWRERADRAIAESGAATPIRLEVGRLGDTGEAGGAKAAGDGGGAAGDGGRHGEDAYERALASVAVIADVDALTSDATSASASGGPSATAAASGSSSGAVPRPEDPMILMYTSGTTGLPKGALLPHRKTLANCRNARACFAITRADRVLVVAPLFHSLGLQILALPALAYGAGVVIQEGFDAERVWRTVEREGITYLGGVPTTHQRLLDALAARSDAAAGEGRAAGGEVGHAAIGGAGVPPRLRFLFTAGAAAPPALIRAYHRRGLAMIQGYGQTETSLLTCLAADRALAKAGSVGRPLPLAEIRLIDPTTIEEPVRSWRDVGVGVVGEIVVRGPITMLGYWQRPDATRETLRGAWLRTGDLATHDVEFDLTLVGRAREMYISGGENVYPAEVEAALVRHPDVAEAAVVAVADAKWGEAGRAHLVARPGATLDLDAIADWLTTRLARFKQPREFVIESALPRTASGKVQKHRLGAPAAEPAR